jgi:hypothetical protein
MPQNGPVPTILIELPGGEGVVRGDDGEMVITRDVSDGRGPRFGGGDYRPVKDWLDEGRTLVGGLLPPGAVSAEVIDDAGIKILANVGAGVYVAILHQPNDGHQTVVCCRDPAGRAVARPLPPDWTRTPVTDADVPCPACGVVAYDEVLPTDGSRGGRGGHGHDGPLEPCPITVCRICGHEQGAGRSITRFGSTENEPEDETAAAGRRGLRRAHQRIEKWYLDKLILRGVAFPIYAAENWRAQIGSGWGTLAKPTGAPSKSAREDVTHLVADGDPTTAGGVRVRNGSGVPSMMMSVSAWVAVRTAARRSRSRAASHSFSTWRRARALICADVAFRPMWWSARRRAQGSTSARTESSAERVQDRPRVVAQRNLCERGGSGLYRCGDTAGSA